MNINNTDVTPNKSLSLPELFSSAPNTGYNGALANFSNRKVFATKNMLGFNKYNEVEVCTQCLAPMMYSDDIIPPNTPFSLRYVVDSNYAMNVISLAGSNVCSLPTGGAVNFTITSLTGANTFKTPNTGNINTIGVGVVDMNLYLYRIRMPKLQYHVKYT